MPHSVGEKTRLALCYGIRIVLTGGTVDCRRVGFGQCPADINSLLHRFGADEELLGFGRPGGLGRTRYSSRSYCSLRGLGHALSSAQ